MIRIFHLPALSKYFHLLKPFYIVFIISYGKYELTVQGRVVYFITKVVFLTASLCGQSLMGVKVKQTVVYFICVNYSAASQQQAAMKSTISSSLWKCIVGILLIG